VCLRFYLIAASVSYFAQVGIFEVDERVPRLMRYDKRVRWPCVVCVYVEMMKIKEIKICKGGLVVVNCGNQIWANLGSRMTRAKSRT
jgi:hypothetical protein